MKWVSPPEMLSMCFRDLWNIFKTSFTHIFPNSSKRYIFFLNIKAETQFENPLIKE